jgi:hypothetical protein
MGGYAVPTNVIRYYYVNPDVPSGNTVTSNLALNPETTFTSQALVPSSSLSPGSVIRLKAAGIYGSGVLSLPLTIRIKVGTVQIGSVSFTPLLNLVSRGWEFESTSLILADNTVETQGFALFSTTDTAAMPMDIENSTSFSSLNSNMDWPITVTVQWGTLALGGTIQLRLLTVQVS